MTDSIKQQLESLAAQMGVKEEDVMMLAQSVIISLQEDNAVDAFMSAEGEEKAAFVQAYAAHAVKKFQKFIGIYLTRGREAFTQEVWSLLKDQSSECEAN